MTSGSRPPAKNTLRAIGEDELIRRIARQMRRHAGAGLPNFEWGRVHVQTGIGDDTAIVRPAPGAPPMAITTDMLVEGVHFLADHPADLLGAKAVTANLSDLAAVGAWPAWILVSFGAPGATSAAWVASLYRGMNRAMRPYGCLCIGGDCVRAERLTINIVAGGNCDPQSTVPLRSRAKVGQALYVTGTLGDSGAGLHLLQHKTTRLTQPQMRARTQIIKRHQDPTARVAAGIAIARLCPDAAMMDLSDGLATDLPRMSRASGCGFQIELAALPISPSLNRLAEILPHTPQAYALYGGEDYELAFTTALSPEAWIESVQTAAPGKRLRVTRIGYVTKGGSVKLVDADGKTSEPSQGLFKHY